MIDPDAVIARPNPQIAAQGLEKSWVWKAFLAAALASAAIAGAAPALSYLMRVVSNKTMVIMAAAGGVSFAGFAVLSIVSARKASELRKQNLQFNPPLISNKDIRFIYVPNREGLVRYYFVQDPMKSWPTSLKAIKEVYETIKTRSSTDFQNGPFLPLAHALKITVIRRNVKAVNDLVDEHNRGRVFNRISKLYNPDPATSIDRYDPVPANNLAYSMNGYQPYLNAYINGMDIRCPVPEKIELKKDRILYAFEEYINKGGPLEQYLILPKEAIGMTLDELYSMYVPWGGDYMQGCDYKPATE